MGVEMLVGCQHGDFHQTTDLECVREVRARDKNFGIIFLEVLFGLVEVEEFSKKNYRGKWKDYEESLTYLQLGGDRGNGAGEETEKQKRG